MDGDGAERRGSPESARRAARRRRYAEDAGVGSRRPQLDSLAWDEEVLEAKLRVVFDPRESDQNDGGELDTVVATELGLGEEKGRGERGR